MPIVTAKALRLAYGPRELFRDADLSIHPGDRLGLVGDNGAGKSTLAKLLVGLMEPDNGSVVYRGGSKVAYLAQEVSFETDQTAQEYLDSAHAELNEAKERHRASSLALEGASKDELERLLQAQERASQDIERLGGWEQSHRSHEIAHRLGLRGLNQKLSTMSGGERRRVALAKILVSPPHLAVLDEPTNHLDVDTIEWLEDFLMNHYRGALLLITHDRYILDQVVNRTVEIDQARVFSYEGGWSEYLEAKAERLAIEAQTEANRQNVLRRELDWLRRSPQARTTKSKSRIKRAEELAQNAGPRQAQSIEKIRYLGERSGKTILELDKVGFAIGDGDDRVLIEELTLGLREGERVGIVGKNGCGKTTLLRLILGELTPTSGRVRPGFNTKFAYFDQERRGLDPNKTIVDNVATHGEKVEFGGVQMDVRSYLKRFLFDYERQRQKVTTLSGGERARVALARFLLTPANVLILDEPTNDLDVSTLSSLEEILIESQCTLLFVTHDRYFLDRVSTSVLSFEGQGVVTKYEGSYQALKEARNAKADKQAAEKLPTKTKKSSSSSGKKKGLTFTEAHELKALMPAIEAKEQELERASAELAEPDLYASRGEQVPALLQKKEALEQELEVLMTRWETLEAKKDEQAES